MDFPFTPEFNQTLTIQPDGYITLRGVGMSGFEEAAETQARQSEGLAKAWVRGRFANRTYCAGIATARAVRIDSFAASMISLTPTLIPGETGPSTGLLFRIQYKK